MATYAGIVSEVETFLGRPKRRLGVRRVGKKRGDNNSQTFVSEAPY